METDRQYLEKASYNQLFIPPVSRILRHGPILSQLDWQHSFLPTVASIAYTLRHIGMFGLMGHFCGYCWHFYLVDKKIGWCSSSVSRGWESPLYREQLVWKWYCLESKGHESYTIYMTPWRGLTMMTKFIGPWYLGPGISSQCFVLQTTSLYKFLFPRMRCLIQRERYTGAEKEIYYLSCS